MGQPTPSNVGVFLSEYIGQEGELGELKHLSNPRKRKRSDSLSSGERRGNSLNPALRCRGLRDRNVVRREIVEAVGKPRQRE